MTRETNGWQSYVLNLVAVVLLVPTSCFEFLSKSSIIWNKGDQNVGISLHFILKVNRFTVKLYLYRYYGYTRIYQNVASLSNDCHLFPLTRHNVDVAIKLLYYTDSYYTLPAF